MREVTAGVGALLRGFSFWRTHPAAMARGLLPAALVGVVFLAGLVALGLFLPQLTTWATPFAEDWPGVWAVLARVAVGAAVFGAALALCIVTFTALTLIVGEPWYDSIWRIVEQDATGEVPGAGEGFWRGIADGIRLIARGIAVALVAGLTGLIPLVGGVVATAVGVTLTGALLADELTARALSARGIDRERRRRLRRTHRRRTLSFGVATQVCFLVPLGAVFTMPAAVAGSTLLALDLLGAQPERSS